MKAHQIHMCTCMKVILTLIHKLCEPRHSSLFTHPSDIFFMDFDTFFVPKHTYNYTNPTKGKHECTIIPCQVSKELTRAHSWQHTWPPDSGCHVPPPWCWVLRRHSTCYWVMNVHTHFGVDITSFKHLRYHNFRTSQFSCLCSGVVLSRKCACADNLVSAVNMQLMSSNNQNTNTTVTFQTSKAQLCETHWQ